MPEPDHIEAGNRDYQRRLAESLVGTMGVEDALQICLAHGWEGMIENVLYHADRGDKPRGLRHSSAPGLPPHARSFSFSGS